MLPADSHAHSEWSWDARVRRIGSMRRSCSRAAGLGLPAIAFTEHQDFASWVADEQWKAAGTTCDDGLMTVPLLDLSGYRSCIEECRSAYPTLRIRTGVEVGEPHLFPAQVERFLARADFEVVLGSLHCIPGPDGRLRWVDDLFSPTGTDDVMRKYLEELLTMVTTSEVFGILAHVDYPIRYWPAAAGPFDPARFEAEYRAVFSALARSGRTLEVNTKAPMPVNLVRWWYQEGGETVSFGSDAHRPDEVAHGFACAAQMVQDCGFRPGRHPYDLWRC